MLAVTFISTKYQAICPGDIEGPYDGCVSLKIVFQDMENIFDHIHQENLKSLTEVWQHSYYFSIIISMEKIRRRAFGKAMQYIDEELEAEGNASENSLTTIFNNSEDPLLEFSENFIDEILGSSGDICDANINGWSSFEDFFPL